MAFSRLPVWEGCGSRSVSAGLETKYSVLDWNTWMNDRWLAGICWSYLWTCMQDQEIIETCEVRMNDFLWDSTINGRHRSLNLWPNNVWKMTTRISIPSHSERLVFWLAINHIPRHEAAHSLHLVAQLEPQMTMLLNRPWPSPMGAAGLPPFCQGSCRKAVFPHGKEIPIDFSAAIHRTLLWWIDRYSQICQILRRFSIFVIGHLEKLRASVFARIGIDVPCCVAGLLTEIFLLQHITWVW
jgi:hypothetical protein